MGLVLLKVTFTIFLKGSLDDIWLLFLTMQVVAYLNIYDVIIPAAVSIYVEEFRHIVCFEALKPDYLVNKFMGTNDYQTKIILSGSL